MDYSKTAAELHRRVPPDWYFRSIKENILQRLWHEARFSQVEKVLLPVKGKVLDVGCADGTFSKVILEKTGAEALVGLDILKTSIAWAKKHWRRNAKLSFRVADAHRLPFEAATFDAVVALEILEHVHEPKKVLLEIKRVLKRGGFGVFLVPTDSLLFRVVWFFWKKSRGRIWEETHIQTYRHNYLVNLCRRVNFRVEVNRKFLMGMLQVIRVKKK